MSDIIKLKGLKDIEKNLAKLESKQAKSILRRSLRSGSLPMAQQAKENFPDDPNTDTSAKQSIKYAASIAKGRGNRKEQHSNDGDAIYGYIGPTASHVYAMHVENGTSSQAPQAPLGRAFNKEAKPTIERISQLILTNFQKMLKKNAKKG